MIVKKIVIVARKVKMKSKQHDGPEQYVILLSIILEKFWSNTATKGGSSKKIATNAKLLHANGANTYVKSRYGDDALRTACLMGAYLKFDLKTNLEYPAFRIAEAHELIASTFLDEHNETKVSMLHWRLALHLRYVQHTVTLSNLLP